MPSYNRQTACYAFRKGKTLIILDFGTGISRFKDEQSSLLEGIDHIYGFLSHYHPDHTIGLFYQAIFLKDRTLTLYAPGEDIYGNNASKILDRIYSPPAFSFTLSELAPRIEIIDIPNVPIIVDNLKISFRVQRKHVQPSVAIRISDYVVYCTDTEPEYATCEFARGADVLLHECWFKGEILKEEMESEPVENLIERSGKEGHSSDISVGLISGVSKVKSAYLVHHNPFMTDEMLRELALQARGLSGIPTSPAFDCQTIDC